MRVLALFSLLTLALVSVKGAAVGLEGRVVGGDVAVAGEFPWQVSLRRNFGQHFCGGTLIGARKVLTAAHCIVSNTAEDVHVVTGAISLARGGEYHGVTHIVYHEDYLGGSETSWRYDVALLTLDTEAANSTTQYPIPYGNITIPGNTSAIASGWGRAVYPGSALPTALQKLNQTILSNEECGEIHSLTIYDEHICAMSVYGEGICSGDSGGPLIVNGEVVGVTSWATLCARGRPDVYARVSALNAWITEHLNDA